MSENSLQNQKNEVSFVLSEKAKAVIEKFEEKLREGNFTVEERNGIRADLVWLLLGKEYPEAFQKARHIIETKEGLFEAFKLWKNNIHDTDSLITLGLVLLYVSTSGKDLSDHIDLKDLETLEKEVLAVTDFYSYEIVTYNAYKVFQNKYIDFCIRLSGLSDKVRLLQNDDSALFPLWWILLSMDPHRVGNNHIPNDKFDLVILSENKDTADESSFYLNGNTIQLKGFINDYLSDKGTLFFKAPDYCINKTSWLSFRQWVIDNNLLLGVIQLPHSEDYGQILVISKKQTESIFFVDAKRDFVSENQLDLEKLLQVIEKKNIDYYKSVSYEDYRTNNSQYYTFVARQFVSLIIPTPKEGERLEELRDLVDLYESKTEENIPCFFLNRKYYLETVLESNSYDPLEATTMPQAKRVPNGNFFLFKWDDYSESFLCSFQFGWTDFETEYHSSTGIEYQELYDSDDNPILCTYPDAIVFKIKDNPIVPIDFYYLVELFSTNEVVSQLNYYQLPYSDISINKEDFLSIKIAVPSIEEQRRLVDLDRQKALADSKEEIKKNFESYKQDIRMKKHAMAQRLTVMNNWWRNLLMAREEGKGIVDDDATVGHLHPIPVSHIYTQIGHEINMLFKQLNSFNLGDAMDSEEIFDAAAFVREYINHHDPMFEYQCELLDKPANIRFPKEAFRIIMDNIASNACSHGFKGRETEDNIIRIIMKTKGSDLVIKVSNNGIAMPAKMNSEKVFAYGDTTEEGVGEHAGLGGFQIKDLMTKFGGEVELELEASSEFPVTYKMVFRDVNIYK